MISYYDPGDLLCQGSGASKKAAKDEAARTMLAKLDERNQPTAVEVPPVTISEDDIRPTEQESRESEPGVLI